MKKISLIFLILVFLTGCASLGVAEDEVPHDMDQGPTLNPPEEPNFAQINQSKMDLLSWQLRYWKENQRAVELKYTTFCFKDVEYRTAVNEIDRITKQMQHLLLP